ncbi:MAG: transposase [Acidobacteria bacterium]|nr:transposase [Acidobacteriota bacterium]
MPRSVRALPGGHCYHVINRGNGRARVFHGAVDYREFLKLMTAAGDRVPMRLLAYCLMPNHIHLVLWPREDGELSRWMQWLMTTQVRRHHRRHGSDGHLWQGRFKAFPIQRDAHLLSVLRYVERNPLRAGLVARAEDWPWSSLGTADPTADRADPAASVAGGFDPALEPALNAGPLPRPSNWRDWVNEAEDPGELAALRHSVNRGAPWGTPIWTRRMAVRLGIGPSLRPRGRPPKRGGS